MIILNQPEKIHVNGKVRLQAKFKMDGVEKVLWYETDEKYGSYMTAERSDAFLVGLLWLGLKHGHDIQVLGPLSEKLYYSLNEYLIPFLRSIYNVKPMKIICSQLIAKPIENEGAVGTGLSCGIDSFHTIMEHIRDTTPPHYKITHVTFFNVGFSLTTEWKKITQNALNARIAMVSACAKELGIELIVVNSNLADVLNMDFPLTHTFRSMSAVMVFQKLFHAYYYASTFRTANLKFNNDAGSYDIISLPLLSTESLSLFSSGSNCTRVQKTRMVAQFQPSYNHLNVCINQTKINCGRCIKCKRTLLTMEVLGVINKYKNVFNLAAYNKVRDSYYKTVLKQRNQNRFYKEIYTEMVRTDFLNKRKKTL